MNELIIGGVVLLVLTILVISINRPLVFLVCHLLSRELLDSMSGYTYQVAIGGLSYMQLYTITIIAYVLMYLVFKGQIKLFRYYSFVYIIIATVIMSSILTGQLSGLSIVGLKWFYLVSIASFTFFVLKKHDIKKVVIWIWLCLLYPIANQFAISFMVPPKFSVGMYNYIGTFGHENDLAFYLIGLLTFSFYLLLRTGEKTTKSKLFKTLLAGTMLTSIAGLYFNNYRTTLVAIPIILFIGTWYSWKDIKPASKMLFFFAILTLGPIAAYVVMPVVADQFRDVAIILSDPGKYFDFSGDPKPNKLLSGRIDLWNILIGEYLKGDFIVVFFGLGAQSITATVGAYAHNEYISALVEQGLVGLLAFLYAIGVIFFRIYRTITPEARANGVYLGFFLGICANALTNMPFRDMRAMMILGIVLGISQFRLINKK